MLMLSISLHNFCRVVNLEIVQFLNQNPHISLINTLKLNISALQT